VRGLRAEARELWSARGHEEGALVWAVQQAARGGTEHAEQKVRGLRAEAGKLRSDGGHTEAALVWAVQPTARGCTEQAE
jgi:hypothetical protein